MSAAIPPAEVPAFMSDLNVYRYTIVATITFFLYDYLVTFDDEVRLVWSANWSLVKILYFLNRVVGCALIVVVVYLLLGATNNNACKSLFSAMSQLTVVVFIICEAMLFVRVYAIWHSNKKLVCLTGTILIAAFVGVFYVAETDTALVSAGSAPELFGNGCFIGDVTDKFWIFHFILLINETTMLTLTLVKSYSATRTETGHILSRGYRLVAHDGIAYYILVALLSLTSLFTVRYNTIALRQIFVVIHAAIQSVLCSRLLLRLRGAYNQMSNATTITTLVAKSLGHGITTETGETSTNWDVPLDELDSLDDTATDELYSRTSAHPETSGLYH